MQNKPHLERQNSCFLSHMKSRIVSLKDKGLFGKERGQEREEKRNVNEKVNVICCIMYKKLQ